MLSKIDRVIHGKATDGFCKQDWLRLAVEAVDQADPNMIDAGLAAIYDDLIAAIARADDASESAVLAGLQAPEPFSGLGPVDAALVVDVVLTPEERRQLAELGERAR